MRNLPCVVRDVGQELKRLGELAALLQDRLCGMAPDNEGIVAMQSLDAIAQGVSGVAEFLTVLASDLPADYRPDLARALRTVRLSSLADRLGGMDGSRVDCFDCELELFGAES